jgi:hypothetical protein
MLLVCGLLIWRHFDGMPWMLEAVSVIALLTVLMGARQIQSLYKFRKAQAELDARRAQAAPSGALRAEQNSSEPVADPASNQPDHADAEPAEAADDKSAAM